MHKNERKLQANEKLHKPGKFQLFKAKHLQKFTKFRSWWLGGKSITRSIFRVAAAWQICAAVGSVLAVGYVMAAFYTGAGEFVIRVDHPGKNKLVLSDTPDFSQEQVLLKGEAIDKADNISIYDIDPQVAEVDGAHYGRDYIAYTFYVKNIGMDEQAYDFSFSIRNMSKGIDKALWVMLYVNGRQTIYAAPSESGNPECQFSAYEFPFMGDSQMSQQTALSNDNTGYLTQEVVDRKGYEEFAILYQLESQPFESAKVINSRSMEPLEVEGVDKYTIVAWLEGEDPECVNDILGGNIELIFKIRY